MNNDMLPIPIGTTAHINPEDIKREFNGGDLISRRDIKDHIGELLLVYSGEELANAILNAIDNAEAVEYTFEEAFQKTVCENKLYCPNKRPKTEWVWHKGGYYKCANCGEIENAKKNYCSNCGAPMINDDRKEWTSVRTGTCYGRDTFSAEEI